MSKYLEIIQKIHSSPFRFVLVSSGGGTNAISEILKVPGASRSVLEAYVPYAKESLDYYLLKQPDHYCSLGTTCLLYTSPSPRDVEESRLAGWA